MFAWLFGKKPPALAERVWMDDAARWAGVAREAGEAGALLLVAFFDGTLERARACLADAGIPFVEVGASPRAWDPAVRVHVVRADRLRNVVGRVPAAVRVCAVEAHPLPSENRAFAEALAMLTAATPTFHASLDDPLLARFGGERLRELMGQMGMTAEEPIEHPLVGRSLANARDKIAGKVRNPREAPTVEAWFARNVEG